MSWCVLWLHYYNNLRAKELSIVTCLSVMGRLKFGEGPCLRPPSSEMANGRFWPGSSEGRVCGEPGTEIIPKDVPVSNVSFSLCIQQWLINHPARVLGLSETKMDDEPVTMAPCPRVGGRTLWMEQ